MRRTSSALTTMILGAAITASTVSAQQLLPSAASRRTGSAAPAPATEATPAAGFAAPGTAAAGAAADPIVGMAATRGARYLLRNGIDYINYQEYERAIKYLREAEQRQKELNDAERLALKQAIERAQRGLREAVGEAPYALSRRSTRPGGFAPARPAVQVATATSPRVPARPGMDRSQDHPVSRAGGRDAEGEDQGEPIRLAAAEVASPAPAVPAAEPHDLPRPLPIPADAPQPPAEIPALEESPAQTEGEVPTAGIPSVLEQPAGPVQPAGQEQPATPIEAAPATVQEPMPRSASDPQPNGPGEPEPAARPAEPAPQEPKPADKPAVEAPVPAVIQLETLDKADIQHAQAVDVNQHADASVAPASASTEAPAAADDLPPLPPQGRPEKREEPEKARDEPTRPEASPPAVAATTTTTADDLPPLPSQLSREAELKAVSEPPPPAAEDLPPLPGAAPSNPPAELKEEKADAAPTPSESAVPMPEAPAPLPPPAPAADASSPPPALTEQPVPVPVPAPAAEESRPEPPPVTGEAPEPAASAPAALPAPAAGVLAPLAAPSESILPRRDVPPTMLSPELQREVEEVARLQEEESRRNPNPPADAPGTAPQPGQGPGDAPPERRSATATQVDISRAPSPAEARPIRAIPVPDDWVPMTGREWTPQRKYWAAAATCHLPLYFQDPMLERYGHSVEQYFGPAGRFLAYPVDSPTQTTQRNQIVQPFFSAGLFAWQILTWPYALVVDPPWEAQYDLGYWRPGDRIPTDLYYQPLHGTGPWLRGRKY